MVDPREFLVLVPIVFIGGYVQTVLRPLAVTLSIALADTSRMPPS